MKKTLIIILLILAGSGSMAQSIWTLSMEPATPVGDMRNFIENTTFRGLSASTNWFLNDHITVGAVFQWTSFYQKDERNTWEFEGGAVTATAWKEFYLLPMYANIKYHFVTEEEARFLPYAGLNIGVAYIEQLATVGTYEFENKVWKFALAPEAGTLIPMGIEKNWGFNVGLKYHMAFYNDEDISLLQFINYSIGVYWKIYKRGERY